MDTNNKTNTVVDVGDDGKLNFTQEEATTKVNTVFTEFEYDKIPIVDLVNQMINDAVEKRASDVHFDPTPDVLNVRIRVDGDLILYAKVPASVKKNLTTRIKIISGMNITETRLPQDGAIKMTHNDAPLDMRVSALPIVDGEKIVIRILDYSRSMAGLDTIGLSKINYDKVMRMIGVPNGIILVTGATGSGKSTTVYSMLQKLNRVDTNIITVEDPVEMKMPGLNQVQVMSEIGLTFAAALRSILRQDPDVIMIGEIRDDETARIAVRASITGHLVLSTLHTNNALNTIERLLDMDVERYLLGSALTGVIAQRLAKKLCPKCRKARPVTDYEKTVFKLALGLDVKEVYEAVGCKHCINGFIGRIAVHEVLMLNQDVRDAIVNNASKEHLRKMVYEKGHTVTLLQDGLEKVVSGDTTFDEIVQIIDVESDFGDDEQELKDALLGKTKKKEEEDANVLNNITGNLTEVLGTTPTDTLPPNNKDTKVAETLNQPEETLGSNPGVQKTEELNTLPSKPEKELLTDVTPSPTEETLNNSKPLPTLENINNSKKADYDIL